MQPNHLPASIAAKGLDTVPFELAIVDAEGEIVVVNEAWRRFADANHGIDEDYWVGENYLEISRGAFGDARASEVVAGLEAILAGDEAPLRVEYPCHSPEKQRWFLLEAAGFTYDGERYAVIVHFNVTDRKQAELRSEARANQLETLLGVLTHDIRNPLNVIEGYAELLAEDLGESEELDRIRGAVQRITDITEATLEFTRSGELSTVEPVDVAGVAREAWETVATEDATLSIRDPPTIHGDRRLLLQLFENLFRNAVEHVGTDVAVTVGSLPDGFYVADDGPGIPPAIRETALAADFSGGGPEGLGLAIVQAIVQAHGGEMAITEADGGGARFEFTGVDVAPGDPRP
ncbi:ATP-binding protein [Haloparvum sp. AD34]